MQGLHGGDLLDEARRFLGLVRTQAGPPSPTTAGSAEAARRLFAMAQRIGGTLAETYLRERGITAVSEASTLRFHPRWYRPDAGTPDGARDTWPALLVTDGDGEITAVQRAWLDPSGRTKAPVATPRRAMGHLLGNAVRFGVARSDGRRRGHREGAVAAKCPNLHPACRRTLGRSPRRLLFPPGLRRLYVARDNDPAGHWAMDQLMARAQAAGIEAMVLAPTLGDWNDDLLELGPGAVVTALPIQLAPEDVPRFWRAPGRGGRTG